MAAGPSGECARQSRSSRIEQAESRRDPGAWPDQGYGVFEATERLTVGTEEPPGWTRGLRDNTCISFQSDNGPSRESRNWLDLRTDTYYGGGT